MSRCVSLAAALEELHRALVFFGRLPALERAEVAALAGARILLARIESILSGFQLADHDASGCSWLGARVHHAGTRNPGLRCAPSGLPVDQRSAAERVPFRRARLGYAPDRRKIPLGQPASSAFWSLWRAAGAGAGGSSHRRVECHGGANERLQRLFIDLVPLVEIDGAPAVA